MPGLITSIIGGIQGASAAHNAANAQKQGYQQAASSVNNAVSNANPLLQAAGVGVQNAAGTAGAGVTNAASAAGAGVTNAAGGANGYLSPYINNGTNASNQLSNLTTAGFSFNPTNLQNDPGYQFQLQQGERAVANSEAAKGLGLSGAALKASDQYAQGLAGTSYDKAFGRALSTYQTNVNSLLPQVGMGLGASGQAGSNLINAAQFAGNTGMAGAEYAGNVGVHGAEYAGGMNAAEASNLINAGVYQGNTQIGAGNAIAQGNIGAANSWNGMLGGIGSAANSLALGGFGAGGGWSLGNIGTNFGNLWGASNYGTPGYIPPGGGVSNSMMNGVIGA